MNSCYIIRTIDEEGFAPHDYTSVIDDKREAWTEAKRRVAEYPDHKTIVMNQANAVILWESIPTGPDAYEIVTVDRTQFNVLDPDEDLPVDFISSHWDKDDAWTAFYAAVRADPQDIVLLRLAVLPERIIANSDGFEHIRPAA